MDITALASNISMMKTAVSLSTSVLKKTLDVGKENAAMMIEDMRNMELSVNPNVGSKFDVRI